MTLVDKLNSLLVECTALYIPQERCNEILDNEYQDCLRALVKAVNMVSIMASQATPEEYEEEGGEELDAQCAAEGFGLLILEARKALTEIEKELDFQCE